MRIGIVENTVKDEIHFWLYAYEDRWKRIMRVTIDKKDREKYLEKLYSKADISILGRV